MVLIKKSFSKKLRKVMLGGWGIKIKKVAFIVISAGVLVETTIALAPVEVADYVKMRIGLLPVLPASFYVPAQAQTIFEKCANNWVANCYDKELARVTKENDIHYGINTLHALQDMVPYLRNCHVQAHIIANAATIKNSDSWQELIEEVDVNECGGGFVHGILEVHIGYDQAFTINSASIMNLCSPLGAELISHKVRSCSHFMGHLSFVEVVEDRVGIDKSDGADDLKKALLACKDLSNPLALECANGVFMEDSFKLTLVDHGLAEIPIRDEPRMIRQRARCEKYSGLEGMACWTDLAEIFAELYNYDASKTYKQCMGAPNIAERDSCYFKAVIIMVASPEYDDHTKLTALCAPVANSPPQYQKCVRFSVSGATHYSIKVAPRAAKFCSVVDSKFQSFCFGELGRQITEVGASYEQKSAMCSLYPQFSRICLGE